MNPGIIVIGTSAGGLSVLTHLWTELAGHLSWPVALVQHIGSGGDMFLAQHLSRKSGAPAVVAESFMSLKPGQLYIAPADYHLLVENKETLSLSLEAAEHYCRPAIDPLFISAARVFGPAVIALLLTGANDDGAAGCARVYAEGGQVLIQAPDSAEVSTMPQAALKACPKAFVGDIDELILELIRKIS